MLPTQSEIWRYRMASRILLTGSQGYIGSRLAPFLQSKGHRVQGMDNGYFTDPFLITPDPYPTLQKDVRHITALDLKDVDVVIFLAGMMNETVGTLTSEKIYDPIRLNTARVAGLCKEAGIRFIFSSSCSVYGIGSETLLNEDSPVDPQTPYAINKYQIEQDLEALSGAGFSPIALRLSTVFGLSPAMRFDMLINMLAGMALTTGEIILNSDGSSWRPHIHIEDICEAFSCCVDLDYRGDELLVMNTGQDQNNVQTLRIAQIVQEVSPGTELNFLKAMPQMSEKDRELIGGSTAPDTLKDGKDTRTYQVSFDKIHQTLPGFSCRYSVESGIEKLIGEMQDIKLSSGMFKNENYYRLKKMNALHHARRIDDNLYWIEDI